MSNSTLTALVGCCLTAANPPRRRSICPVPARRVLTVDAPFKTRLRLVVSTRLGAGMLGLIEWDGLIEREGDLDGEADLETLALGD